VLKDLINFVYKTTLMATSYLYFFCENRNVDENKIFNVKIGFASHNKTDEAIKNRKTYLSSMYPVTITRRIVQLQTGNPRKIEPIAFFEYQNQRIVREIERNLHSYFANKKSENSKEWFSLLNEDISDILSWLTNSSEFTSFKIVKPEVIWIEDKWNKV
jgi:hypothetical protein